MASKMVLTHPTYLQLAHIINTITDNTDTDNTDTHHPPVKEFMDKSIYVSCGMEDRELGS
jgi:hypothetical protein